MNQNIFSPSDSKQIHDLIKEFKQSKTMTIYSDLKKFGLSLFIHSNNNWVKLTTYKSDFSDINIVGVLYNSANICDIGGIWVTINR